MDVSGGNVRILASPFITEPVFHFIAAQILFQGEERPGLLIGLDGYQDSIMATETGISVSTED